MLDYNILLLLLLSSTLNVYYTTPWVSGEVIEVNEEIMLYELFSVTCRVIILTVISYTYQFWFSKQ